MFVPELAFSDKRWLTKKINNAILWISLYKTPFHRMIQNNLIPQSFR
jgi:hypothetical protein